jgi:hypothetical protein
VATGLLAALAGSLTASAAAGMALAAVFVTFPETLVRGAHGAYFAATVLLSLVILDGLEDDRASESAPLASALAFLVDQKGLLVPAAWALAAPFAAGGKRFLPLAGGLIGAALFLTYGLAVDAPTFLFDFVSEHVTRRLSGSDIRFAADAARFYPSIPELWAEYLSRYGLAFVAWALLAVAVALGRPRPAARAAAAAVLLGALVFSVVDWRQTRHLALLTTPAVVAIAGGWPRSALSRRVALIAAGALVLRNLWAAWPLLCSFESLRPRAGW